MNQTIISSILSILNTQTVDFHKLAETLLSGLNNNQTESPNKSEKLTNMISIVKATEKNPILSKYIPSEVKEQTDRAIVVAEYCAQNVIGDHLSDDVYELVIDDLDDFIRQTEKNIQEHLTEVLTEAGIRI